MNRIYILEGNPKSTQTIYRSSCAGRFPTVHMTATGKKIKQAYQFEYKDQHEGDPITEGVEVHISLFFGDKRKRDVDNFNKLILDAASGIVYDDDVQIQRLTIEKHYDKEAPRAEVTVNEIKTKTK